MQTPSWFKLFGLANLGSGITVAACSAFALTDVAVKVTARRKGLKKVINAHANAPYFSTPPSTH